MKIRIAVLAACALIVFASLAVAATLIDLNTASQKELESLKGVGPAKAARIIAARPYRTVDELSKAGFSAKQIESLRPLVTLSAGASAAVAKPAAVGAKPAPAKTAILDLNTASGKDLEALKGVGPATAKKIIAARPYRSVDELSKAGLSAKVVAELRPFVTVAAAPAAVAAPPVVPAAHPATPRASAPAGPVDLNTASEKDLEALKGVGPATARKIIAARPLASVDDLARAGVPAHVIAEIRPLVVVSGAAAPAMPSTPARTTAPMPVPATPAAAPATPAAAASPAAQPAAKAHPKLAAGQVVNINTASKELLDELPGIGPVKAQAIIDGRPYATIEDIMKVKGIKQGEFAKIKNLITVK